MKRQTYKLQTERLEIFISLNVFLQFFTEEKHCKFTYNDAHNINTAQQTQQPAVYLFDFAFYIVFLPEFYFYSIYEMETFSIYQIMVFLAAVWWRFGNWRWTFSLKKYKNLENILGLDVDDVSSGFFRCFDLGFDCGERFLEKFR